TAQDDLERKGVERCEDKHVSQLGRKSSQARLIGRNLRLHGRFHGLATHLAADESLNTRRELSSRFRRLRHAEAHLENAPDRGRSPSAAREQTQPLWKSSACRPAEADCKNSVLLRLAKRCEPGRFAVRWGQCQVRPARRAGPIQAAKKFSRLGQRNKFRAPDAAVLR